jgi:hypothetical protein
MSWPLRFLLAAGVLTAAAVGAGVLVRGDPPEPARHRSEPTTPTTTPFTTTPLADYDTTAVVVTRAPFCEAIDDRQVEAALGVVPDVQSWQNGDRVDLGNGVRDVGHEFGCRYAAPDSGVAEAWVFAPPVGAAQAGALAKRAARAAGCQPGAGPAFGSPTLALICTAKDGTVRASYRGLFGDAWLVCELDRPPGATWDAADRAGRWCVGVLQAAGGSSH